MPNRSRKHFTSLSRIAGICALFLTLVSGAAKDAVSDDLRKIALVVGNSGYENIKQLKNPSNDAALLYTVLTKLKFQLIEDKPLLDLTRDQFNKAILSFLQAASKADVALFYYAGHGVQMSGENYLVPIDTDSPLHVDEKELRAQMINANKFLNGLSHTSTTVNLIILDACRDDPFAVSSRSLTANRGLAEMKAPQASIIWYATAPGRVAQDGSGDNGPFAAALAHNILAQSQDVYRVLNKTGMEVLNVTAKKQIPWIASSPISGIFYLNDGNGESRYEPFTEEVTVRTLGGNPSSQIFARGLATPSRAFAFGETYRDVNADLDSSFQIHSWESLPRAGEFGSDDVRYFWVRLLNLPSIQSALANIGAAQHCIDPASYITFFFKKDRLFHISLRFFRSSDCPSYDWVRQNVIGGTGNESTIGNPNTPVSLVYHKSRDYDVLEITKKGIADEKATVWKNQ
jgi:hypothetical protein